MEYPSQFTHQTGEVKKINPMMDVRFLLHDIHCDEPRINNLEVTRPNLYVYVRPHDQQKITNFPRNFHIRVIRDVHEIEFFIKSNCFLYERKKITPN